MERERLTRLLEDPARITRQDLADLVAMAERYPWFSGAQLLRAAGERLGGEVLSDETLRVAGAHLPSRAVLFDLTNNPTARPAPMHVVRVETIPPVEETALVGKEVVVLATPPPTAEATEVAPEPMVERVISHALPTPVADPILPVAPSEVDELDLQILESAVSGAYDLTILEQLPEAPAPPASSVQETMVPRIEEPLATQVDHNARLRFSDWLEASDSPVPLPAQRVDVPLRPVPAAKEQLDTTTLIDRFIRHETPEPKKTAFFTPQQAGKRSLDDSAGLVTETLARIYARQGNTAKAIDTYNRLAVKYPEKSAYFAALSKALEEQLNP